jgi:hypothetical protein
LLRRKVWNNNAEVSEVLAASIALMMEASSTSETSANFYQTTRRNNPEDAIFRQLNYRLRSTFRH